MSRVAGSVSIALAMTLALACQPSSSSPPAAAPRSEIAARSAALGSPCDGVTCAALDQCHLAGVCDSNTGVCSNPIKADGTACNDGDACTTGETCHLGICQPGAATACGGGAPYYPPIVDLGVFGSAGTMAYGTNDSGAIVGTGFDAVCDRRVGPIALFGEAGPSMLRLAVVTLSASRVSAAWARSSDPSSWTKLPRAD
jgi:hypothetical protein